MYVAIAITIVIIFYFMDKMLYGRQYQKHSTLRLKKYAGLTNEKEDIWLKTHLVATPPISVKIRNKISQFIKKHELYQLIQINDPRWKKKRITELEGKLRTQNYENKRLHNKLKIKETHITKLKKEIKPDEKTEIKKNHALSTGE